MSISATLMVCPRISAAAMATMTASVPRKIGGQREVMDQAGQRRGAPRGPFGAGNQRDAEERAAGGDDQAEEGEGDDRAAKRARCAAGESAGATCASVSPLPSVKAVEARPMARHMTVSRGRSRRRRASAGRARRRHAEIGRSRQRRQRPATQQIGDPAPHDDRQQRRERRLHPPRDIDPRPRAAASFAEPDDAEQREREQGGQQIVREMAAEQRNRGRAREQRGDVVAGDDARRAQRV